MKQYFLFGKEASNIYHSQGNQDTPQSVALRIMKTEYDVYEFDKDEPNAALDLILSYDGWNGVAKIDKFLYHELNPFDKKLLNEIHKTLHSVRGALYQFEDLIKASGSIADENDKSACKESIKNLEDLILKLKKSEL